ncbi:MAG TPA: PEGA domain-containing protein [Kofleriaceae bacterium]|nr:PEGA domain-containing protein [Kofleriaceae bacterium]
MRCALALIPLAVLAARSTAVRAEEPHRPERTIAVVSARLGGDADVELRSQAVEAARRGFAKTGYAVVGYEELRASLQGSALLDCTSRTCLEQISEEVGADHFVRLVVESSGAAYSVQLELLDLGGQVVHKLEDSCAVCTITELNEMVSKVASDLITTRDDTPLPVLIVTRPAGAELTIDGKSVGAAPYSGMVPPGTHVIGAHQAGHEEAEKTIEITRSETVQRFEIILVPVGAGTRTDQPRPYKSWKWVTAGGAVATLLTGFYLIALDADGTCSDPAAECPRRYATMAGGLSTTLAGFGLGAASAWMFMRDQEDARRARAALVPTRGGAFAAISFGF